MMIERAITGTPVATPVRPAAGFLPDAIEPAGAKPARRWSRRVAADIVGFGDMAVVLGALIVTALIVHERGAVPVTSLDLVRPALVACLIVYGCFVHWRLYDTRAMQAFPASPEAIVTAAGIGTLAVFGLQKTDPAAGVASPLVWPALSFVAAASGLIAYRLCVRRVLASLTAAGRFDQRIAVYGSGAVAERVEAHIRETGEGLRFIGAFDDRTDPARVPASMVPISGSLADLIQAGRDGLVDRIIVALPQTADQRLAQITAQLEQLPLTVHAVTHFSSDLIKKRDSYEVSNLGPVGLLTVKDKPLADWAPIVKRVEDVLVSATLLVLTLPLFLVIAAAVKATSPGPVFFRQRRRGLNQRVIEVLKFRTMTVLEDGGQVRQATANDHRVTRVGWLLRRSSLDELPQLLNVLSGEMSLVGPRPHALIHDEQWGELLEQYANRHQVKPGITGLAQVRGLRGETRTPADIEARVEADLEYIATWSVWSDLKIIARTVAAVFGATNAH